jgi:hypothetical protein
MSKDRSGDSRDKSHSRKNAGFGIGLTYQQDNSN